MKKSKKLIAIVLLFSLFTSVFAVNPTTVYAKTVSYYIDKAEKCLKKDDPESALDWLSKGFYDCGRTQELYDEVEYILTHTVVTSKKCYTAHDMPDSSFAYDYIPYEQAMKVATLNYEIKKVYDEKDRWISTVVRLGNGEEYTYITNTYDDNDRLIRSHYYNDNGQDKEFIFEYDKKGRQTYEASYYLSWDGEFDSLISESLYTYNKDNSYKVDIMSQWTPYGSYTLNAGRTIYSYDKYGVLAKTTTYKSKELTKPLKLKESRKGFEKESVYMHTNMIPGFYIDNGKVVEIRSDKSEFHFYAEGICENYCEGNCIWVIAEEPKIKKDKKGRITEIKDSDCQLKISYDSKNRVSKIVKDSGIDYFRYTTHGYEITTIEYNLFGAIGERNYFNKLNSCYYSETYKFLHGETDIAERWWTISYPWNNSMIYENIRQYAYTYCEDEVNYGIENIFCRQVYQYDFLGNLCYNCSDNSTFNFYKFEYHFDPNMNQSIIWNSFERGEKL